MSAAPLESVVTPLAPRPARAKAKRTRRRRLPLDVQIVDACEAMVRYALASGKAVPESVVVAVQDAIQASSDGGGPARDLDRLVRAHAELVHIVAPATPRTILLLSRERESRLAMLGPVRLVRHMLIVVIVLLAAFVLLATSPEVNHGSGDIFTSSGMPLLLNELFLLTAGGLGAAFSSLFTASRYIKAGTYDPKHESTYWLRLILGLMAGLLLAALIPVGGADSSELSKPLLALLGGFSASVLYRILERLVQTVESLVRGETHEQQADQLADAVARQVTQNLMSTNRLEQHS
jgi:hypothetical protein